MRTNHIYSDYLFLYFTSHISATWLVCKLTSPSIDWLRVGLSQIVRLPRKTRPNMTVAPSGEWNINVTSMWISHLFSWTLVVKQLLCWHSFNLKFIRQGAPPSFCLYFFHFRCFNLVPTKNPMFVLAVPIRQKTEVSQQKFAQKHSHQHTFSWFPSVPGKTGHAELVCTDTEKSVRF